MKLWMISLCFLATQLSWAQDPRIEICGKSYEITGDFLTIIISENIKIKSCTEAVEKVKADIHSKYQSRVSALEARHENTQLSLIQLQDSFDILEKELHIAQQQVELLGIEFSTIDFTTTSYLYQLAFYFFNQGQLDEASAIMTEESLLQLEYIQAQKHLLNAQLHWRAGDATRAINALENSTKKYPFYELFLQQAQYLIEHQQIGQAIAPLHQSLNLAGSYGQQIQSLSILASAYHTTNDSLQAQAYALKCIRLNDSLQLNRHSESLDALLILIDLAPTTESKIEYLQKTLLLPIAVLGHLTNVLQLELAIAHQKQNDYQLSKELLEELSKNSGITHQFKQRLMLYLAISYQKTNALHSAIQICEQYEAKQYEKSYDAISFQFKLLYIELLLEQSPKQAKKAWRELKSYIKNHRINTFNERVQTLNQAF